MARRKAKAADTEDTKPAAAEKPKYGVPELADALGIEPSSVRVNLRKMGVEKNGRSYGWDTKKDFDAVLKDMKSSAKADDGDGEEKPKRGRKKKVAA